MWCNKNVISFYKSFCKRTFYFFQMLYLVLSKQFYLVFTELYWFRTKDPEVYGTFTHLVSQYPFGRHQWKFFNPHCLEVIFGLGETTCFLQIKSNACSKSVENLHVFRKVLWKFFWLSIDKMRIKVRPIKFWNRQTTFKQSYLRLLCYLPVSWKPPFSFELFCVHSTSVLYSKVLTSV